MRQHLPLRIKAQDFKQTIFLRFGITLPEMAIVASAVRS
jgi:hypothetical protein